MSRDMSRDRDVTSNAERQRGKVWEWMGGEVQGI